MFPYVQIPALFLMSGKAGILKLESKINTEFTKFLNS